MIICSEKAWWHYPLKERNLIMITWKQLKSLLWANTGGFWSRIISGEEIIYALNRLGKYAALKPNCTWLQAVKCYYNADLKAYECWECKRSVWPMSRAHPTARPHWIIHFMVHWLNSVARIVKDTGLLYVLSTKENALLWGTEGERYCILCAGNVQIQLCFV